MSPSSAPSRVAVIMAAFNDARYIEAAMKSLLNQQCEPFTLIVSDDASTDATADIAEAVARANTGPHTVRLLRQDSGAPQPTAPQPTGRPRKTSAAGLPGCRAAGRLGCRAARLPGCQGAGPPGHQAAGPTGRQATGPPGRRHNSTIMCVGGPPSPKISQKSVALL